MGTVIIGSQRLAVETGQIVLTQQDTFDGFYLRKQLNFQNQFAEAPNVQLQLAGVATGDMTPRFEGVPLSVTPTGTEVVVRLEQAVENAEVKARLLQKSVYNDEIDMTETVVETTTDADGYWELQLVETTNMKPTGSQYSIIITTSEYTKEYRVGLPTGLSSYRIQDLV